MKITLVLTDLTLAIYFFIYNCADEQHGNRGDGHKIGADLTTTSTILHN